MTNLKEEMKLVREDVLVLLEFHELSEADLSEGDLLAFIATAALKRLASNDDGDTASAAKVARKLLKPHLKHGGASSTGKTEDLTGEATTSAPERKRTRETDTQGGATASSSASASLSLGQYASTDAFKDDESKKAKFARLMGGGKADARGEQRNTQAVDSTTIGRINRDLENQYEAALIRKGRKGLGA